MPHNFAQVSYLSVDRNESGQRLDNWLLARLKGVPRSRIYKIIRSGEVRINKGRAKASSRLAEGDVVRMPPVRLPQPDDPVSVPQGVLDELAGQVLYRDTDILVVNKPAGLAVHSGSGVNFGLIDAVRSLWGEDWQLVHRLDRGTSGCLLLVRQRELQNEFQQQLQQNAARKTYQALVHGVWPARLGRVESYLQRTEDASGDRRVQVSEVGQGQLAISEFRVLANYSAASLLQVDIETGRTHQIRVQAAEAGHPLVGDHKYGRKALDAELGLRKPGLCLHAWRLGVALGGRELKLEAPLPQAFAEILQALQEGHS